MLDYLQLETLSAVLRHGSFDAAAAALNVTQSAVSQRIRQLEERVGAPLVRRGQPCVGTDLGLQLARHCDEVALLEKRIIGRPSKQPTRLRIAVNADSLATWVLEALAAHDDHLYDIVVDDQDYSGEWLKRGEVSAAITSVSVPPQGCDSISLGDMTYVAMASPEFTQKHFPDGVDKLGISKAPMIVFNTKDKLQSTWIKDNFGSIHNIPTHQIPSTQAFVDAALLSMGWGMNPQTLVDNFLQEKRLVELLPGRNLKVPLFWQYSRLFSRAIAPLTQSIVSCARRRLD